MSATNNIGAVAGGTALSPIAAARSLSASPKSVMTGANNNNSSSNDGRASVEQLHQHNQVSSSMSPGIAGGGGGGGVFGGGREGMMVGVGCRGMAAPSPGRNNNNNNAAPNNSDNSNATSCANSPLSCASTANANMATASMALPPPLPPATVSPLPQSAQVVGMGSTSPVNSSSVRRVVTVDGRCGGAATVVGVGAGGVGGSPVRSPNLPVLSCSDQHVTAMATGMMSRNGSEEDIAVSVTVTRGNGRKHMEGTLLCYVVLYNIGTSLKGRL